MTWLLLVSAVAAWVPARTLAEKWGRGVLVPVAAIIGIVSCGVVTVGIGALLDYSNPDNTVDILLKSVAFIGGSLIISPIAAIVGWQRAKKSEALRPSFSTPEASDNLDEDEVLHRGVKIEKVGDKFIVDGREYNSQDTARAYIDHYKN